VPRARPRAWRRRGQQAKGDAARDGRYEREREHAGVDADRTKRWKHWSGDVQQRCLERDRQDNADGAAHDTI
jgi:hypothetical protein